MITIVFEISDHSLFCFLFLKIFRIDMCIKSFTCIEIKWLSIILLFSGTSLNSLNQNRAFQQAVSASNTPMGQPHPQQTIQFQPLQSTTTSLITGQAINPLKRKIEDDYDQPSWRK